MINSASEFRKEVEKTVSEIQEEEIEQLILEKITYEKEGNKESLIKAKKIDEKLKKISALKKIESFQSDFSCNFPKPFIASLEEVIQLNECLNVEKKTWEVLLDHQKEGISWLLDIHFKDIGGLLGDEMGLGKTVMVSVFIQSLLNSNMLNGGVLIVSPATIIDQWMQELKIWAPTVNVYKFSPNSGVVVQAFTPPFGIVLCTYEIIRTHKKELQRRKWFYVILDEGHKIKNMNSQVARSCKEFSNYHRLILSGTPIQNSLNELWSIFDFLCPGLLGSNKLFCDKFGNPITRAGYCNSTVVEVEVAYECSVELRKLIQPYILRRTKRDVDIGIPKHEEKIVYCDLSEDQWEVYCNYLREVVNKQNLEVTICIKDLRLICNHPCILKNNIIQKLNVKNDSSSGKLKLLEKILTEWKPQNHSIVIFSQYKKMLTLTENTLRQIGISYSRIDGDVLVKNRIPEIQKFNSGAVQVLLLTIKVGGLGINLPKASRVILLDPDWNPMNDNQAKERALRIGQRESMIIYRFVTKDTIEEKIYLRQLFKLMISEKILSCPEQKRFFSSNQLYNLFSAPQKPAVTEEIVDSSLPAKRQRETNFFNLVLASNIQQYEQESVLRNAELANYGELYRVKSHAKDVATKAIESIRRSLDTSKLSLTKSKIGTGLVLNLLKNRETSQAKDKTNVQIIAERLLDQFRINRNEMTSAEIVEIAKDSEGFDKYLFKSILKEIAKKISKGRWKLKEIFLNN